MNNSRSNKKKTRNSQVEENYKAFKEIRFSPELNGRYALLHDQKLMATYHTGEDAFQTGLLLYKKVGNFSVQKVGERPAGLGFVSTCLA